MSETRTVKVFITDHHVDAIDVTRFDGVRAYAPGYCYAEGRITGLQYDDPLTDERVDRTYTNVRDLPPVGSVIEWDVEITIETSETIKVAPR